MSLSLIETEYLGGPQVFPTNFALGVLETEHLSVQSMTKVDGLGDPLVYDFTYDVGTGDVTVVDTLDLNEQVLIKRTVPKEELFVEFIRSDITPRNIDNTVKQALMAVHEVLDQEEANRIIAQGALDIAEELEATIDDRVGVAEAAASAASISASDAASSASAALASQNASATSESNAGTSESNAASSAATASSAESTAVTQAGNASVSADLAADWAEKPDGQDVVGVGTRSAKHHANVATAQADVSTTKASEASASATTASTQADIATTKAAEASTSADNAVTSADAAEGFASDALASILPIGVPFPIWDHITGVPIPSNAGTAKFIRLSAGLTGAGEYNEGLLTDESVSGSAPTVTATAVIAVGPAAGQAVALVNTEGAFLRPGSSGVLQEQSTQNHKHRTSMGFDSSSFFGWQDASGLPSLGSTTISGQRLIVSGTSGATSMRLADTDTVKNLSGETRPRNRSVTMYMRIA